MTSVGPYEVSSVHLTAFLKTARALGVLDGILPRLSTETRAVVDRPSDAKWFSARVIAELTEQLAMTAGGEVLEELNYRMTRDSLGRLVQPVIKVALAITGNSPATVFARLGEVLAVAMRGVQVAWTPSGPKGGSLRFTYPEPPPPGADHSWRGAIRFGYELASTTGSVTSARYVGNELLMELTWK